LILGRVILSCFLEIFIIIEISLLVLSRIYWTLLDGCILLILLRILSWINCARFNVTNRLFKHVILRTLCGIRTF
jgi:hypothetical protein